MLLLLRLHGRGGGGVHGWPRRRDRGRRGRRVAVGVRPVKAALEGTSVRSRSTHALGDRRPGAAGRGGGGGVGRQSPPYAPRRRSLVMVAVVVVEVVLLLLQVVAIRDEIGRHL